MQLFQVRAREYQVIMRMLFHKIKQLNNWLYLKRNSYRAIYKR
ncbi:hypothetical protein VIBNIAM115_490022 [Vibrio nigripulchritudo AM115]|nr:hypothetical protein VIBNIAM115_490022 [Vibrio nigripulchritudo AM115]